MKIEHVITDNSSEKIWVAFESDRLGICRKDKTTFCGGAILRPLPSYTVVESIIGIVLNRREASELVEFIQKEFLKGEENGRTKGNSYHAEQPVSHSD